MVHDHLATRPRELFAVGGALTKCYCTERKIWPVHKEIVGLTAVLPRGSALHESFSLTLMFRLDTGLKPYGCMLLQIYRACDVVLVQGVNMSGEHLF